MKFILFVIFIVLTTSTVVASEIESKKTTLPFLKTKYKITSSVLKKKGFKSGYNNSSQFMNSDTVEKVFETEDVSKDEIIKLIQETKETICSAAGKSTVKIYFSFGAETNAVVIGTNTSAGFEITFECLTD